MNIVFFNQHAPRRVPPNSPATTARLAPHAFQQMLGGIAHELSNCVSPLSFFCEMLDHDGAADQQGLEAAKQALTRCAELVHDLRALATPLVDDDPLTVAAMMVQADRALRIALPRRIAIRASVPADVAPLHSDGQDLRHAILMLGLAAADAMPQGGRIDVVIAPSPEADDRTSASVAVLTVTFTVDAGHTLRAPDRCVPWQVVRITETDARFEWRVPLRAEQASLAASGSL